MKLADLDLDKVYTLYALVDGKYAASRLMAEGDTITSSVLHGFKLDLSELFANMNGNS